jgi:hypothetical protein
MKVTVLSSPVTLGGAYQAFNDDGSMRDEAKQNAIQALGRELTDMLNSQG